MDCRRAQDMLHAWIDMELTEGERVELTAHLAECPHCAKKLAEYRHLDILLNQLDAQIRTPAGLYGRIMEAVSHEAVPGQGISHRWARWAASAAAVLLLGAAVGVLWRAGVWPAPMKSRMRYGVAEDAAPMEAPGAEPEMAMGSAAAENDTVMGLEEMDQGEPAGDFVIMARVGSMEVTWAPEDGEAPLDMIDAFCEEHGLTVVESGDDWVSVQWSEEGQREALLSYLTENGELTGLEDREDGTQVLRINLR